MFLKPPFDLQNKPSKKKYCDCINAESLIRQRRADGTLIMKLDRVSVSSGKIKTQNKGEDGGRCFSENAYRSVYT